MQTVPHTSPDTPDFTDPAVLAAHIDQAADLIARNGKFEGDLWPLTRDDQGVRIDDTYGPGAPCCTVGAIAVVLGVDEPAKVDTEVIGLDPFTGIDEPHPVMAAVMDALCATQVEQVFAWSDSARDDQVVARLRYIAAQLRIEAAEVPAAVA